MANFVYNVALKQLLDGDLDFSAGSDIRVLLLETAAAEDKDHATVAAVVAADTELSSTGYTRTDGTLTSEATSQDDANDRAEADADNATFSSVSQDAAEQVVAYVIFKFVTDDSDSIPIEFIDTASGIPLDPDGGDITITWNAEGFLQLSSA